MRALFGVILIAAIGNVSADAHHSLSGFFNPKMRSVSVEGRLESIVFANPHVTLKVRAADSTLYTIIWDAIPTLERQTGITKDTFKVGDHLIVVGGPSRNSASTEIAMVREVRRPKDGWMWRSRAEIATPVAAGGAPPAGVRPGVRP